MAAQSNAQQTFEELVAAVKQAESRGKRYAADGKTLTTSPKGALGEMQVMPKTILDPGFGVTPARDKSPDEIARVGVDYLQAMKQRYGDTEKALIAYNWGPGSTDKWIAAGSKPEALPAETRTYVQRVKGFLGKDVSRETMAKKDREPLPESLPPMAKAPESAKTTTVAKASSRDTPDIKSLPASYQAAFALAALADAKDDEDDKAFNEFKETEAEKLLRDYKPVNYLASLDLSVQPIMMNEGGEVEDRKRPDDINYFSNVNRMKDRGTTTDSVMLGASKKVGEGSLMAGLNMANMSRDEKLQTARALMLAYTQQDPEGLGINANIVKPEGFPAMANLVGSMPLGEGRVSAGMHGNKAYSLGYNRPVEGGQFDANLTVPRGTMGSPQLNLRYEKRFAEGGDVDVAGEDVSKPFFGNPNIRRQVGQARRIAAVRNANYGDELGEAKDTARKGEAYQELEKYLQSRGEMPSIKIGSYLPDGTHGVFFSDRANISTGDIKINKNLHDMYVPSTIAHEVTHAADRQMKQQAMEQGMFGKSNQFTEAYEKMVGPEGRNRTQLLRKRYPEFEEDNRYYRSRPDEVAAHGIGAYSGPAMQDRAPRHVDATAATEFRILMDLAQRNVDKGPTGLAKVPAFFRKLGRYADGGEVEPTAEELAAASTPAFIAQKSGIGRKEGNISKALKSGEGFKEAAKGLTMLPQNIVGAPVDLATMAMRPFGYNVEKPVMGSEYLKEKSRAAGLAFKPSDDPTLAGFFEAGDLASNLVNPAGATRTGVKAAEKTGEAAKMLARDFQQYNQELAVPGASYAIRNRGTPFLGTPAQVNFEGKVLRPAMSEADDYADWLSRTFAHGEPALKTWLKDKVGAYLRRDFGTESDQMVQAAEQGKKLHFMSPRLTENVPHELNAYIDISRELEGFPKAGVAKTPQGKKVEEVIDSTIFPLQLQDISAAYQVPKSMEQFVGTNPEMRVSQMGPIDENLKFDELAQAMEKMFKEKEFKAYGETVPMPKDYVLTEDTLKGLTPAQASNRVANKMEWVEKKRGELAGVAIAKDPKIVSHSYDNGSKWISPADLADHPNHAEMVKDIGCAGGWCTDKDTFAMDYGSGENRLNILLDKKFEPRVQLTVNSPPTTVREFILANPHLPEIDAIAQDRTITAREADRIIKAMPEYLDFVKQNQNVKSITEIKGQFNNSDLTKSPYLKQVQDFVKRQGPDLQSVHNLDGIDMLDMRVELPSMRQYGKGNYSQGLLEKLLQVNGNSYFAGKDEFPDLIKKAYELPNNAARQIQMNMFQPPTQRATGGMIERQPTDNRRYL